ncbi:MAG: hypothetical protein ACR2I4_05330 [Actinomycetota bacterium]
MAILAAAGRVVAAFRRVSVVIAVLLAAAVPRAERQHRGGDLPDLGGPKPTPIDNCIGREWLTTRRAAISPRLQILHAAMTFNALSTTWRVGLSESHDLRHPLLVLSELRGSLLRVLGFPHRALELGVLALEVALYPARR